MTELDRQLDDFGTRLARAAAQAPPPRRRPRRPLALGLATAVAALGAVAVVLAGSGGRSLDPVAEARAALAPPGAIVYMKITSTVMAPGATSVPQPQTTEQWWVGDPPRWRFVQHVPRPTRRSGGMLGTDGRPLFGRIEHSYGAGVVRRYVATRDTLDVTRGYRDGDGAAKLPSVLGSGSGDPEADMRSMLFEGRVIDRGEQDLRGRTVRRFVIEQRSNVADGRQATPRLVYDVDPQTFAPIEGRFSLSFGVNRPRLMITSRMRVDAYRRIALTADSAKLLRIRTTPRTKATFDTAQAQRARMRASRAKCRKLRSGDLACPPPFPAPKLP